MATAVTDLRAEAYGRYCYVLFIEGIGTAYTTDESGDLAGSGLTSWIGVSEQAIVNGGGSDEVIGERTVKKGLIVPGQLPFAVDPKTGELKDSPVTFKILDLDASLRTLFATAGKDADVLFEYVPAGTSALDATLAVNSTTNTVDPADKYIGIERIGPNRERNFFPVFPDVAMPGPEHFYNTVTPTEPGAIKVSDDPIQFAGRKVALYRIYKDHHDLTGTYDPWPDWKEQFEAGGLVWWGVMEDAGRYEGNDTWSIRCHGPAALLQKPLGIISNMHDGVRISAPLVLNTDIGEVENKIGVYPTATYFDGALGTITTTMDYFDMSKTVSASDTNALRDALNTILDDCAAGTGTTAGTLDHLNLPGGVSPLDATGDMKVEGGTIMIKKDDSAAWYTVNIVAHEKVWRAMGFDPSEQSAAYPFSNVYECFFQKLDSGATLEVADGGIVSTPMPGPGYWAGTFDTRRLGWDGETPSNTYDASNNEQWRRYKALFNVGVDVLVAKGNQLITLPGSGSDWYCQGDRSLWLNDGNLDPDGVDVTPNRAGYFAVRGKIVRKPGEDPEEIWQVFIGKWRNAAWAATAGSDDGMIVSDDFYNETDKQGIQIMRWLDPRLFGFNHKRLDVDWSFTPLADGNPITIYPLSAYAYFEGDGPEYADATLGAILCSTGTSTGYSGPLGAAIPSLDQGDNNPGDASNKLYMHGDVLNYSMACGIPEELIGDAADIRAAFDDPSSPFNRVRVAWLGRVNAEDIIKSILEPRRMGMSLHGRKYTPRRIDSFTSQDATILEADLSGQPGDPTTVIPTVELRSTGVIDKVELSYRYDAAEGGAGLTRIEDALDSGAKSRTGKVRHRITDWGLVPLGWYDSEKEMEAVTGQKTWGWQFREIWGVEAAEFYSKRHFTIRGLPVDLVKGQDLFPLSRVRVTNPWVLDAEGNMGVTQHAGLVLKVNQATTGRKCTVDVLMFEDGSGSSSYAQPHYAPCARVLGWDSATDTLYLYDDFRGHGDTALSDVTGFAEPAWSSFGGGNARVQAYYWDGSVDSTGRPSWTLGPENTVSSADDSANTLTMTGAWSSWTDPQGNSQTTLLRDMEWLVVLVNRDHASSPAWCDGIYGFYVDATFQTGGGTLGRIYL